MRRTNHCGGCRHAGKLSAEERGTAFYIKKIKGIQENVFKVSLLGHVKYHHLLPWGPVWNPPLVHKVYWRIISTFGGAAKY